MKFSTVALLTAVPLAQSFSIQSSLLSAGRRSSLLKASSGEFDAILGEGSSYVEAANAFTRKSSSPVVRVPDGSPAATVTLVSSVAAPAEGLLGDDLGLEDELLGLGQGLDSIEGASEESVSDNPLLNNEILKRQHEKNLKKEQFKASGGVMKYVKNPGLLVKGKDFSDITLTIFIPAVLSYVALKKVGEIVGGKLTDIANDNYDETASKMAYHAGDIEEMQSLYKECMKKNWFQGAQTYKGPELFKKVMKYFLKVKRVSPKTVSSLQYLVSVSGIADDEIAELFNEMASSDPDGTTLPLALLFYSERLMKSKGAKNSLHPILDRLTARMGGDEEVVKKLVSDVGVQAYRDTIADAGKDQTKITEGWKALGLDKETATNIFKERQAKGFMTLREELKYDEQRRIAKERADREAAAERIRNMFDADGNVVEHDDDEDEDDDDEE